MFDIWRPAEPETVARVAVFQRDFASEHLVAEKTRADECEFCPFPGYRFVRLTYSAQRVRVNRRPDDEERYEVVEGTISYLLLRKVPESDSIEVIPLNSDSATLYAINKQLGLKLTKETVATYLVFFGLVIAGREQSFYFVTDLDHIQTIRRHLSETSRALLDGMIQSTFNIGPDGSLDLGIKEKEYWLLGKAFTLTVPVFYSGGAYKANVRVSEMGVPAMDEHDPTTIRGLDDQLPISKRYPLEFSSAVAGPIHQSKRALESQVKAISGAFAVERILCYLLLPTYLLSLGIVFYLGVSNDSTYKYYQEIRTISILNWSNLILGTLLALGVTFRFLIMELAAVTEKWVPNQLASYFQLTTQVLAARRKAMGLVIFMGVAVFEFMSGAILALNVLLYGISNVFHWPAASADMNFVETFFLVGLSVPGLGAGIRWMFGITGTVGLYRIYNDPVWGWLSAAFLSTIAFGWVLRLYRMSKKSD